MYILHAGCLLLGSLWGDYHAFTIRQLSTRYLMDHQKSFASSDMICEVVTVFVQCFSMMLALVLHAKDTPCTVVSFIETIPFGLIEASLPS